MQWKPLLVPRALHWDGFSLWVCSLNVSLCSCCKLPLASSLKLCTSFALLIMTPGSSHSLAFSYPPEHLETSDSLCCPALATGSRGARGGPRHTFFLFLFLFFVFLQLCCDFLLWVWGLLTYFQIPNCSVWIFLILEITPPTTYLRLLDLSHAPPALLMRHRGVGSTGYLKRDPSSKVTTVSPPLNFSSHEGLWLALSEERRCPLYQV